MLNHGLDVPEDHRATHSPRTTGTLRNVGEHARQTLWQPTNFHVHNGRYKDWEPGMPYGSRSSPLSTHASRYLSRLVASRQQLRASSNRCSVHRERPLDGKTVQIMRAARLRTRA